LSAHTENEPAEADPDIESGAAHSAPEDAVLAERLGVPSEPIAIYLEETSPYRPIVTGDVFQGVAVPGATGDEQAFGLTMVIAHPSAMRKGAELEPRARAAPIVPVNGLSRKKWAPGHFNVFPLPLFSTVASKNGFEIDDRAWGVLLELAAPVETAQLDLMHRVACLSPEGIHQLLQRLVHADTRFPVKEDTLALVFAPKLDEIELLENWNEELVAPLVEKGADLDVKLREAAQHFDDLLNSADTEGGVSLRAMLEDARLAGRARKLVATEIRHRRAAAS
jgi:hypothetical protein